MTNFANASPGSEVDAVYRHDIPAERPWSRVLEHFPFSVNREDSQRAANKILWSSQAEEAGNGVFERSASSSDPGC